jgi:hypothetical protein
MIRVGSGRNARSPPYLSSDQGPLRAGERIEADLTKIFVDPERLAFRLRAGSLAIAAGVSVGLDEDIAGTRFPQGKPPDLGAYRHLPAEANNP